VIERWRCRWWRRCRRERNRFAAQAGLLPRPDHEIDAESRARVFVHLGFARRGFARLVLVLLRVCAGA
jgi:hypothetical protein